MEINVASYTDKGKVRKENQDCLIVSEDLNLYCVSDGMGGLEYGKVTAEIVRDQLILYIKLLKDKKLDITCETIEKLLCKISQNIQMMGNVEYGHTLYGATLTGLLIHDNKAFIMNVGDSRVYKLCNHQFVQLTKDQSLVQYWVDLGKISEIEAKNHPRRNIILEFMGKASEIHPGVNEFEISNNEIYCICSDGLFSMIEESRIQEILESNLSLDNKCQQLIDEANIAGGKDNISVVLVEVKGV